MKCFVKLHGYIIRTSIIFRVDFDCIDRSYLRSGYGVNPANYPDEYLIIINKKRDDEMRIKYHSYKDYIKDRNTIESALFDIDDNENKQNEN